MTINSNAIGADENESTLDEVVAMRVKLEQAKELLRETIPELNDSISAIGDDHSVGICCCGLINLADRINSLLTSMPIYAEQDEPEEITP